MIHWPHEQQEAFLNTLALLSRLFWGPDAEALAGLKEPGCVADLATLAQAGPGGEAFGSLAALAAGLPEPARALSELESEYVALFEAAPGGIAAPLYQSFYQSEDGLLMGRAAQDMAARLQRAGLAANLPAGEPADHLAVELEYLFLLLEGAMERRDQELAQLARDFAGGELAPWLAQVCGRLEGRAPAAFYTGAAAAALALAALLGPASPQTGE